nr:aminotransferase class V-fold PLP-dependent enzyme [Acuticoccus mangrovi]
MNHGAYGLTPLEVMKAQRNWRQRIERQPARFYANELPDLIRKAIAPLARLVGADPERTVLLENTTAGLNAVLRSLSFAPGERVVTTSHVYDSAREIVRYRGLRTGVELVEVPVPMPLTDHAEILEPLVAELTPRTRLVIIDHVTSPSALIMPVAEIVAACRERGIPVLVDGAHAPGMLDLDVTAIGAHWYVGNAHKWLSSAKGAAFLVAAPDAPPIHPAVISHAYGQGLVAEFGKIGTRDPSAWLSLPKAVAVHEQLGGAKMRARNRAVANEAGTALAAALGTSLAGGDGLHAAMVTIRLPDAGPATPARAAAIRDALWELHQTEVAVKALGEALLLRISVHAYNAAEEVTGLAEPLTAILAEGS